MNYRMRLTIFIFLGLTLFTIPDVKSGNPKKYYFHFVGKINNQVEIDMNLVKINDSVYGNYSLVSKGIYPVKFMEKTTSAPVQLYGKVNSKNVFIIKENPWNKGGSFTGKLFDETTLKGTWQSGDGGIKYPFELKEYYPEASIRMSVYFRKGSVPLVNRSGSPTASFQYCLLSPQQSSDSVLTGTLTKLILSKFMGKPVRLVSPDMILNAMKQIYFDNYITTNESIYKEQMGASFSWESLKFMDVILNRDHLLTFYIEDYNFTGGAHGLQTRNYTVVDLRSGKAVSLNEIFTGDYEPALTDILTARVRKMHNIDPNRKLTDNGFFVESVKPTNNFYITSNGIGFFYNQYEIAPYSDGPDDIFIPFSELKGIQVNNAILNELPGHSTQP
jgi:hypothetical protein